MNPFMKKIPAQCPRENHLSVSDLLHPRIRNNYYHYRSQKLLLHKTDAIYQYLEDLDDSYTPAINHNQSTMDSWGEPNSINPNY